MFHAVSQTAKNFNMRLYCFTCDQRPTLYCRPFWLIYWQIIIHQYFICNGNVTVWNRPALQQRVCLIANQFLEYHTLPLLLLVLEVKQTERAISSSLG